MYKKIFIKFDKKWHSGQLKPNTDENLFLVLEAIPFYAMEQNDLSNFIGRLYKDHFCENLLKSIFSSDGNFLQQNRTI